MIRGIYSNANDEVFKNGVPTFETIEECTQWMRENASKGSNPQDPNLRHALTHLIDWDQVKTYLIDKLVKEHRAKPENGKLQKKYLRGKNSVYSAKEFKPVVKQLISRLDLSFYSNTNTESTLNTLKYLFHHMRCGIFVCIRDNDLKMFVPFVNKDYTNTWGDQLRTDPEDLDDYYREKRHHYRRENIIPDKNKWWANGNIICNEHHPPRQRFTQWWGDNMCMSLRHMFETLCKERKVPDVEFFVNKRDYPQLKTNLTEPYDFVFDKRDTPLTQHEYNTYAPIMSFYCSPTFSDIPMPTTEDWESAVGKVFPPSFIPDPRSGELRGPRDLYLEMNFRKFHCEWSEKVDTAFFRGNATGGGTTPNTNQRMNVAKICQDWNYNGTNLVDGVKLLDAGITGFNARDKKLLGRPMTHTKREEIGIRKSDYIPMYEQGKFKYILYIEGHCAANRYSFLMRLGSVIFKVESKCEASEIWYFPLLKPYEGGRDNNLPVKENGADHITIKADYSDLREKILWCRENDEKCKMIAQNAQARWQRCLSKEPLLDYLQLITVRFAENFRHPPLWYTQPKEILPPLKYDAPKHGCGRKQHQGGGIHLCKRCRAEKHEELHAGQKASSTTGAADDDQKGSPLKKSKKRSIGDGQHRIRADKRRR